MLLICFGFRISNFEFAGLIGSSYCPPPYGTESFLFLVTVNRADSDPWMTQLVFCRLTTAPAIVWAPVFRVLPRICTMLGGKSGKELPSKATPTPSKGTRTTRWVRCTEV